MSRDSKEDFSCDEGDKENRKTTIVQEEELVEYKPGVGWLLYTVSNNALLVSPIGFFLIEFL